jgi:hypothetical protein
LRLELERLDMTQKSLMPLSKLDPVRELHLVTTEQESLWKLRPPQAAQLKRIRQAPQVMGMAMIALARRLNLPISLRANLPRQSWLPSCHAIQPTTIPKAPAP